MSKLLNQILLVDDSVPTNLFHRKIIEKYGCAKNVIEKADGHEALEYLSTKANGTYPRPELVFVDINMPKMNGWEFVDAFNNLDDYKKENTIIVMLTSSLNPEDEEKAKNITAIKEFRSKPLTMESLDIIVKKYFFTD